MQVSTTKTKIEHFIEALLLAGRDGIEPRFLGMIIKTNVINSYAQKLRAFKVVVKTLPVYSIPSFEDASIALQRLNLYRVKRGAEPLSGECLLGWEI
jgi:hypothetical protein